MELNDSAPPEDVSSYGPRYTGFRLFFRLLWRSVYRTRDTSAPLSLKRLAIICLVLPWAFPLIAVHRLALLLDNILFPGYRRVQVKEPVFMVGIPRSGTTFLYHLLAKDEENFTAFHLWEIAVAPSIIERKFWTFVGRLDRAFGRPGYRVLVRLEDRFLADMRKIHYMSLFKPDEDELVLVHFFATALLLFAFPFPEELWALLRFDTAVAPPLKRRIMAQYKACVQRHLYVHGSHKHFLSKNPTFSPKIDALGETFPDARIICNVRNPYEAAPSLLSLLSFFLSAFGGREQKQRMRELSIQEVQHLYRHPIDRLSQWPSDRYAFVKYHDLAPDPRGVVRGLYERLGLKMNDDFDRHLCEEQQRALTYKSPHTYSLAQYELSPGRILEEFGDVFAYFGFDTKLAPQASCQDDGETAETSG